MLELDYTNVLEQTVHNHGIPKIAFQKAADSSKHVVEAIHQARTSGKLGFGDLPADQNAVKTVTDFARSHAYPNVLLLGIGGSALGPAALEASLNRPHSGKRLIVLDNIDPDFIRDSLDAISPQDTDRKSTRLNSSHTVISYAVFCLKKKTIEPRSYGIARSGAHVMHAETPPEFTAW